MNRFSPDQPRSQPRALPSSRPRVLLLGLGEPEGSLEDIRAARSLDELALLADTWGGEVVCRLTQLREKPDPAWYVGRGKLAEVVELARTSRSDTIVTDSELTPTQLRNMERELGERGPGGPRVIDRTQVILEIFARRAHSREGKLQVELAQAVYALPRLVGKGLALSRLGGGIGTRGPGETKLEADRRRLRDRISELQREIHQIGRQRETQAKARREKMVPLASLVGYTNAGKSALFNRLTGSDVLVEDKLFATLDPIVRRLELPNGQRVLVSDTVGFVRKLPHHLVAAFRATLDEVREADVLLHVIDVSDPCWPDLAGAATAVLGEIGVTATPVIYVLNKTDLVPGGREVALRSPEAGELSRRARVVGLSAATGSGVGGLLCALEGELADRRRVFAFRVPYTQASVLSALHEEGHVLREDFGEDGVTIEIALDRVSGCRFEALLAGRGKTRPGQDGR